MHGNSLTLRESVRLDPTLSIYGLGRLLTLERGFGVVHGQLPHMVNSHEMLQSYWLLGGHCLYMGGYITLLGSGCGYTENPFNVIEGFSAYPI